MIDTEKFLAERAEMAREFMNRSDSEFPNKRTLTEYAETVILHCLEKTDTVLPAGLSTALTEVIAAEREGAYMFLRESDRFNRFAQNASTKIEIEREAAQQLKLESFSDSDLVFELQRRLEDRP